VLESLYGAGPTGPEDFLEHLKASGVTAGNNYSIAIPDQPSMLRVKFDLANDCSNARRLAASEVGLPIHPI
jgi:hypothetical protein